MRKFAYIAAFCVLVALAGYLAAVLIPRHSEPPAQDQPTLTVRSTIPKG